MLFLNFNKNLSDKAIANVSVLMEILALLVVPGLNTHPQPPVPPGRKALAALALTRVCLSLIIGNISDLRYVF